MLAKPGPPKRPPDGLLYAGGWESKMLGLFPMVEKREEAGCWGWEELLFFAGPPKRELTAGCEWFELSLGAKKLEFGS